MLTYLEYKTELNYKLWNIKRGPAALNRETKIKHYFTYVQLYIAIYMIINVLKHILKGPKFSQTIKSKV